MALSAGAALAQGSITCAARSCPSILPTGEELRTVPELRPDAHHVLITTFTIREVLQCIPVQDSRGNGSYQPQSLRSYVYKDPGTGKDTCGYPGPTFRIRKEEVVAPAAEDKAAEFTPGDRRKILLVNDLEPDTTAHGQCDDTCAGSGTDCSVISKLPTRTECAAAAAGKVREGCCCVVNQSQTYPECFHDDNTPDLHFHGTHVSPQPPQDFVLLELRPKLPPGAKPPADDRPMDPRGTVTYGRFQYDVDPQPTQAEGTHW